MASCASLVAESSEVESEGVKRRRLVKGAGTTRGKIVERVRAVGGDPKDIAGVPDSAGQGRDGGEREASLDDYAAWGIVNLSHDDDITGPGDAAIVGMGE